MGAPRHAGGKAGGMKILTWQEFLDGAIQHDIAATIGVFDGLHRGHRALLEAILHRRPELVPVVFTFRENPKKTLHPATYRGCLLTLERKLEMLAESGVEYCVLIDFSRNFATLSGRDFLSAMRSRKVRVIAVGENFRFGYRLDSDAALLQNLGPTMGIDAVIVKSIQYNGHPVSSSRIRTAILEGRLHDAAVMLGRPYEICARVCQNSRGPNEESGCAVAEDDQVLPPDGAYATVIHDGQTVRTCWVVLEGRMLKFGVRMQSDVIRAAFTDTVQQEQEKEIQVWL